MADTSYGVSAPEAVKLWSRKLMREALKQTWASRFMGKDSNSVIQVKDETSKSAGDRVRTILRMQLSGAGVSGDNQLENNEEALTTYTDDLLIDQLRHAVRSAGKMTEQRIPFSIREEARMALQDWWADRWDTWFMNQISGNTTVSDTRYTGMNSVTAPSSSHWIIAGGHSAEGDLTATAGATFDLSLIDQAVLKARTLSPMIRPISTGKAGRQYVMFISPEQHYDLRRNTNTLQWADVQKAAMQGGQVSNNPIFTGALGMYNGVVLHESSRLPYLSSTGGSMIARAVFCGAQAAVMAFGRNQNGMRMSWNEELFDYNNKLGVEAGTIAGLKKTVYNSADFATLTISTAVSTAARAASGR